MKTLQDQAAEEVERFKEVAPMPIKKGANPLNWWKEHETEYPLLSTLTKRYLCTPGTSVFAERIFSTAGRTCGSDYLKNLKTKEVQY